MEILKGDITLTDNLEFVKEILFSNSPNTKIISLDESNSIPLEHPNVIGGICLLPPIDALIAEADGDEELYNQYYYDHFTNPSVEQFVAAVVILLMSNINLLVYIPEIDQTNTAKKLMEMFWRRYGIGMGVMSNTIQKSHNYDYSASPIWLGFAIKSNVISCRDYLYAYPIDCSIPDDILQYIIMDISPLGDSYTDKANYIYSLVYKLKEKPNLIIPIFEDKQGI